MDNNNQPVVDEVKRMRTRTISKNIGQNEDNFITLEEVKTTISNLKLDKMFPNEAAHKIFNNIDKENKGRIRKSHFIAKLEEANKEDLSYILFLELNKNFSSKCEQIIHRLKRIMSDSRIVNDKDIQNDFTWIINALINGDIYQTEAVNHISDEENKDIYGFVGNVETNTQKRKDLETVINSVDKYKTKSIFTMRKQRATMSDYKKHVSQFNITNDIFTTNFNQNSNNDYRIADFRNTLINPNNNSIFNYDNIDNKAKFHKTAQSENNIMLHVRKDSDSSTDSITKEHKNEDFKENNCFNNNNDFNNDTKIIEKPAISKNFPLILKKTHNNSISSKQTANLEISNLTKFKTKFNSNLVNSDKKENKNKDLIDNNKQLLELNEDSDEDVDDNQNLKADNINNNKNSSPYKINSNLFGNERDNKNRESFFSINHVHNKSDSETNLSAKIADNINNNNIFISKTDHKNSVSSFSTENNNKKDKKVGFHPSNNNLSNINPNKSNSNNYNVNNIQDINIKDYPSTIENISTFHPDALDMLKNIDDKDFNIFVLEEHLKTKTVYIMTQEVFNEKGYFDSLIKEKTFYLFLEQVIKGYDRKIPYHNDMHAGDVFQTVFTIFSQGDLEEVSNILITFY